MKLEILEERDNPLLERRELVVKVVHDAATPPRADVRDKIAALITANKDTVILDSLKSKFGVRELIAVVKVYKTKERAFQIEPKHKLMKNFPKEEIDAVFKLRAEAKPEEKKEETKKPEVKKRKK